MRTHPWIFWHGGNKPPVPPGTLLDLKYRSGQFVVGLVGPQDVTAGDWEHRHPRQTSSADPFDIVAYRLRGEAPEDLRPTSPWRIVIWPEQYTDSGDRGYGWAGEAADEAQAIRFACEACEVDNGWDEATLDPLSVKVIDADPDWKTLYERAVKPGLRTVYLTLEGGVLQAICSPNPLPGLSFVAFDMDAEGFERAELVRIAQINPVRPENAWASALMAEWGEAEVSPAPTVLPATDPRFNADFPET